MKAITIGSTGAVGRDLLTVLASDPDFERVDVLVRRLPQLPSEHAEKFHVHIIDFEHPETWKNLVTGDVLFSSLGTSKKQAGGKQPQWRVDHDYQLAAAKAARENGVPKMVVISSLGADPASSFFYLQMKGKIEKDLEALQFPELTPSLPHPPFSEALHGNALREAAANAEHLRPSLAHEADADALRRPRHGAAREARGERHEHRHRAKDSFSLKPDTKKNIEETTGMEQHPKNGCCSMPVWNKI